MPAEAQIEADRGGRVLRARDAGDTWHSTFRRRNWQCVTVQATWDC
jgi:hypothetical protein